MNLRFPPSSAFSFITAWAVVAEPEKKSRINELLLSDVLGSDGDEIGREIEHEDERYLLNSFVVKLPPRERQIMEMRFGMNGYQEYTQKEVADALGISQSYISRLEKRIINKLKKLIEKVIW